MGIGAAYELDVTFLQEAEDLDAFLKRHNRRLTMDPIRENVEVQTLRLTCF